jgi:hypothetical protein
MSTRNREVRNHLAEAEHHGIAYGANDHVAEQETTGDVNFVHVCDVPWRVPKRPTVFQGVSTSEEETRSDGTANTGDGFSKEKWVSPLGTDLIMAIWRGLS